MEDHDQDPLLAAAPPSRWTPRRTTVCCLVLLLLGSLGLTAALAITWWINVGGVGLKVMALNTWGMPATFGAEDKTLRMKAIGQLIQDRARMGEEYDVYLLSELWMRPDHATIKGLLPEGYHMTEVMDLNNPHQETNCDGTIGPDGCSGLAIVSKHKFTEIEFFPYSDHGDFFWKDGEYFARKGVGRVRIEPHPNMTIDVFVTHTCASDYNFYYRQRQVKELVKFVKKSDADFLVLGGDFNVDPNVNGNETTYHDIKSIMRNSMEQFCQHNKLCKLFEDWIKSHLSNTSSYANPRNTYSHMYKPVLYDYIFHKANGPHLILTDIFKIPWLTTPWKTFGANGTEEETSRNVSLSDHEAVTAHLLLTK